MILPFCQKKQTKASPKKYTQKATFPAWLKNMIFILENKISYDILYWHSRKSSNDSLYFYEDLYRRFYLLPFSQKKITQEKPNAIPIWKLNKKLKQKSLNKKFVTQVSKFMVF